MGERMKVLEELHRHTGARLVTECGICGSHRLESVLSLGSSPPPCVMHPAGPRPLVEEHYPLELLRCEDCTLVQLSVVVDPSQVFAPEYPYSSGNSMQLHANFENLRAVVEGHLGGLYRDNLVVDIGANDGTLLRKFTGMRTVGVEPTNQAQRIDGPRVQAFFTEEIAEQIVAEHGQARVVTACNVMAHVDDLDTVMRGVKTLLAPGGVFVAENHDLSAVLWQGQWDMVYHEHLRFFSPSSFNALLERHGLGCAHWHTTETHGGSFRMLANEAGHRTTVPDDGLMPWPTYRAEVAKTRAKIRSEVGKRNGRMWAFGATARGTTILNYCGLDRQDIEWVFEVSASNKIGHYIPGTSIPVIREPDSCGPSAPDGLLLSWHLEDIIVPKLRARGYDKPILIPLPEPRWV